MPLKIFSLDGIYGSKYETPKDFIFVAISKWTKPPNAMPRRPAKAPRIM